MSSFSITPGLYGISVGVSIPIIEQKWSLISLLLKNEKTIYDLAFHAVATGVIIRLNRPMCFQIFLICLDTIPGLKPNEEKEKWHQEVILEAMFISYWDLSQKSDYWIPPNCMEPGKHLDFSTATAKWNVENPGFAKICKENIERWTNEN